MPEIAHANACHIGLRDAIARLREEIQSAIVEGAGQPTRFHVKAIELELSIAFTWDAKGTGGVKAWVLELGGESSVRRDELHKIKLQLELEGDPLLSDFIPPLGRRPEQSATTL